MSSHLPARSKRQVRISIRAVRRAHWERNQLSNVQISVDITKEELPTFMGVLLRKLQ